MSLADMWASVAPKLKLVEPVRFSAADWALLERLHACFNDREAHTHLPMPIARFGETARKEIHALAATLDDVRTASVDGAGGAADAMAPFARAYNDDVDAMMGVLVPAARYRKGHYAYGRFTVATPHGLHTDHSAEDPKAAGEPICIARIAALGTHYVAGDYAAHDAATQSMLGALRYWIAVPEGTPEEVFATLLARGAIRTIPLDHVMLMVAGNASTRTQVTQHIAATPPEGGLHSAFFQRQYKLA